MHQAFLGTIDANPPPHQVSVPDQVSDHISDHKAYISDTESNSIHDTWLIKENLGNNSAYMVKFKEGDLLDDTNFTLGLALILMLLSSVCQPLFMF